MDGWTGRKRNGCFNQLMDEWINGGIIYGGWMLERMVRLIDGWMDRYKEEWMEGQKDQQSTGCLKQGIDGWTVRHIEAWVLERMGGLTDGRRK